MVPDSENTSSTRDPLDTHELRTLASVLNRLIPADQHGSGAAEAKVADYIIRALATHHQQHVSGYKDGLLHLDAIAVSRHGLEFAELADAQQDAILAHIEASPSEQEAKPDGSFFPLVVQHAREGMFGDPSWGGNADFVGWKLAGYTGPRYEWTQADQELDTAGPSRFTSVADLPPPPPLLDA